MVIVLARPGRLIRGSGKTGAGGHSTLARAGAPLRAYAPPAREPSQIAPKIPHLPPKVAAGLCGARSANARTDSRNSGTTRTRSYDMNAA